MKLNRLNIAYFVFFFCIILFSCKNEKLPDLISKSNEVQFFAEGIYNSESLKIKAGDNKYYMKSNYGLNGNLYVLKSNLEQYSCDECFNSLEIAISNYQHNSSIANFNIDSVFWVGKEIPFLYDTFLKPIFKPNFATISVTDQFSNKYYSQLYDQEINYLEITDVSPYMELNDKGQKTVKVSFHTSCFLKSDDNPLIDTVTLIGTFAFAYPSKVY